MRFVFAIISFVVAILAIGYGTAQRTVLATPDSVSSELRVTSDAAVTLVEGTVLNTFDGSQTLGIAGSDTIFAAYGRTTDVLAWIGDASYNRIGFDLEREELTSTLEPGREKDVPNPAGSDLWLKEYVQEDRLAITVIAPEDVSFIIVSDGVAPAPNQLSLSWPVDNSTPWSTPLIVGGAALLLVGLLILLWALAHMRKTRGPRRKPPKMPMLPRQPRFKPAKRPKLKELERPATGRRAVRRGMIAIPAGLAVSLVLSGCSSDFWSGFDPAAAPSPSPTTAVETGADVEAPAATQRQVERIVASISIVAGKADAEGDAELAATRFEGPALDLRKSNYAIRAADASIAAPPMIPAGPVKLILPQQADGWPRTVFAVILNEEDETVAPIALFLIQQDARSNYKVHYAMNLEPSAVLPDVASPGVGSSRLDPEITLFQMPPAEIAMAYADILATDTESEFFDAFESEGDSLRLAVGLAAKTEARAQLSTTASITYASELGTGETIVLSTIDTGALVAVNLNEITTVAPVETGAAVNPTGAVKALSGVGVSTKGVKAVYGDQLLFYVPAASSGGKIVLLGYSQGLISASELP